MTSSEARALAARCLAVGFDGARADTAPLAALRALQPGAIILFARNATEPQALPELIAALRAQGDPPPLIAVDQEGGRVERIGAPVTALPAAMAIGALGDAEAATRLGALVAHDLAALGISLNFAPVADLALDPRNTVIGDRAFGERPHEVGRFAAAFARGLEGGGVAATLKHFPGHGATHVDSHRALPRVAVDAATLRTRDLVPFAAAVAEEAASCVMSGHVVVEALDPEHPATLAPRVMRGLLRDELGFTGTAITDCLEMDAIATGIGSAGAGWRAIAAGCDLLTFSHTLETARAAVDGIVDAVARGDLSSARLREAAASVDALRARFATPGIANAVVDPAWALDVARRAPAVIRGDPRLREGAPVTVISFEPAADEGAEAQGRAAASFPSLSAALRARAVKSEIMRVAAAPESDDIDLLLAHLPALGDREFVIVTRRAHLVPEQRAAVSRILDAVPDALVVSAREPYDAVLWPHARRIVATFGDRAIAFEGAAEVLTGRAEAAGRVPVSLDVVVPR